MPYVFFLFFMLHCALIPVTSAAKSWRTAIVHEVVDNQHYRLRDGRLIRPLGIQTIQSFPWSDQEACHSREAFQTLKILLQGQKIKLYSEKSDSAQNFRIKLPSKQELNEFLLYEGFAKLSKTSADELHSKVLSRYQLAQKEALLASRGLWDNCGQTPVRFQLQDLSGRQAQVFKKRYGSYFSSISAGRVARVISGEVLELTNGLHVRLQGIAVPDAQDPRPEYAHRGLAAQQFLQEWLLGRTIFLRRNKLDFDNNGTLIREVFLPPRSKNEPEFFINNILIDLNLAIKKTH